MSTLRDDIEQVVIDHFDPSIMGRAQAVDDILAAVKKHNEALAMRAAPPSKPAIGGGMGMVIHVDPVLPPNAAAVLVEDERRADVLRRSRGW